MRRPSLHERRWGAEEHDFAAAADKREKGNGKRGHRSLSCNPMRESGLHCVKRMYVPFSLLLFPFLIHHVPVALGLGLVSFQFLIKIYIRRSKLVDITKSI